MSGPRNRRRAVILPVVLMILLLLGLLAATFALRVHADRSAMNAVSQRLHARLAAEAGIERALLLLRTQRRNPQAWYSNPDEFNRIIVYTPGDDTLWGTKRELDEEHPYAWRFSLVADNPFDDEERCRYGITDEAAKLNLNTATKQQITRLIRQIAWDDDMVVEELVDAFLDYRDEDDIPRENGAESEYYSQLEIPYRAKNGPLDTVEELLMIKGFDGRVLYGEDQDRNGILTPNEDDGDETFPEDNSDNELTRGLYPYVTVLSRDPNTDPENRPKVYLYGPPADVTERLAEYLDNSKIQFILNAVQSQSGDGDGDGAGEEGENGEQGDNADGGDEEAGGGDQESGGEQGDRPGGSGGGRGERSRMQPRAGDENADGGESDEQQQGEDGSANDGSGEGSGSGSTTQPTQMASPADLLLIEDEGANPLALDDLPILMARTTTVDPLSPSPGLVNVNTASPQVLRCLPELQGEALEALLTTRAELTEEQAQSTAWLVTEGILTLEQYQQLAPWITADAIQFTIQSLGYADHIGTVVRLQTVVEMRGPMAQVLYYRDLTSLGAVFPIREDEEEYGFGGQRG